MSDRISQFIIDVKRDYLDIPALLGPHWKLYSRHRPLFGFNAPGIPAAIWTVVLCTAIAARAGLVGAWTGLANMMTWLVGVMNPRPTDRPLYPDPRLLLGVARAAPLDLWASKPDYERWLINQLEALVLATGPLFQTFSGLDLGRLVAAGESAVFDVADLEPPWVLLLLTDLIACQLLYHRIHFHLKTDRVVAILYIDEADPLISKLSDQASAAGVSFVAKLLSKCAEYGLLVVLAPRVLGGVSRFISNSCQHQIIGTMPDAESVAEARRTLQLRDGAEPMLFGLPPGRVICQVAQSCWSRAVLGQIDHVAPHRGALPEYDVYPCVPSRPLEEMPEVQEALEKKVEEHRRGKARQAAQGKPYLPPKARDFLTLVALHPYVPCARLWEKMGRPVSAGERRAIRKKLEALRLAAFQETRMSRTPALLVEPTREGYEHLNRPVPKTEGRGGLEHRAYCHWIRDVGLIRRCEESLLEWVAPGTGHNVDVAWLIDGKRHVFEVDVGCAGANIVQHLRACFIESTSLETVTLVAAQKRQLDDLRARVESDESLKPFVDRIRYEPVSRFYEELWP